MARNKNLGRIAECLEGSEMMRGRGIRRAISTSKIKKMTASRKNRREKGVRAVWFGSKPHSYGLAFSRLLVIRIDVRVVIRIKAIGMIIEMLILVRSSFISLEA